jgi:hypothetical protein
VGFTFAGNDLCLYPIGHLVEPLDELDDVGAFVAVVSELRREEQHFAFDINLAEQIELNEMQLHCDFLRGELRPVSDQARFGSGGHAHFGAQTNEPLLSLRKQILIIVAVFPCTSVEVFLKALQRQVEIDGFFPVVVRFEEKKTTQKGNWENFLLVYL